MTGKINFKAMLSGLTSGFMAERSLNQEYYRNTMNGGFNNYMRTRTLV